MPQPLTILMIAILGRKERLWEGARWGGWREATRFGRGGGKVAPPGDLEGAATGKAARGHEKPETGTFKPPGAPGRAEGGKPPLAMWSVFRFGFRGAGEGATGKALRGDDKPEAETSKPRGAAGGEGRKRPPEIWSGPQLSCRGRARHR